MVWSASEEFAPPTINPGAITCRGDRALKTAYQTDSESGKEANEANTEEVQVSTSFFCSRDVDFVFLLKMSICAPYERNGTHYR